MRSLFTSEARCIQRMIQARWGKANSHVPAIVSEYIAAPDKPKSKPWFNCDFCLDFVDRRDADWASSEIASHSILPNTLGAELFLAVEPAAFVPMRLDLIGGQTLSFKYYAAYLQQVGEAIRRALVSQAERPINNGEHSNAGCEHPADG